MRHLIPLAILAIITACADVSGPNPVLRESAYSSTTVSSTMVISYTAPIGLTPEEMEFMKTQQQQ